MSAILQNFRQRYKINLAMEEISPRMQMERANLDETFSRVMANKNTWSNYFTISIIMSIICLIVAFAGVVIMWLVTLLAIGCCVLIWNKQKKATDDVNRLNVQVNAFADSLFQEMSEAYEAKKAHGRFR